MGPENGEQEVAAWFVGQVKITTVIGKPIELPKREQPSSEEVERYLLTFRTELAALFERHKAAAGYPNLELLII